MLLSQEHCSHEKHELQALPGETQGSCSAALSQGLAAGFWLQDGASLPEHLHSYLGDVSLGVLPAAIQYQCTHSLGYTAVELQVLQDALCCVVQVLLQGKKMVLPCFHRLLELLKQNVFLSMTYCLLSGSKRQNILD